MCPLLVASSAYLTIGVPAIKMVLPQESGRPSDSALYPAQPLQLHLTLIQLKWCIKIINALRQRTILRFYGRKPPFTPTGPRTP